MTFATAFAQGLNIHALSRQRGYRDGRQGIWAPHQSDVLLDYSLGHADGISERACCVGCAPACKGEDES